MFSCWLDRICIKQSLINLFFLALSRITLPLQAWPGGTRMSAVTETTRTVSPSSPTGKRTGESSGLVAFDCLLRAVCFLLYCFFLFPCFLSFGSFSLCFLFSHHPIFSFLFVVLVGWGSLFVVAWPAWLRWLVPLAPLLPLRPLRSVPRPVRCGWGIKPSAPCTLARQAGPRCPTPTTLWTTARPSKTAGPPTPPVCLLSCLSPRLALR